MVREYVPTNTARAYLALLPLQAALDEAHSAAAEWQLHDPGQQGYGQVAAIPAAGQGNGAHGDQGENGFANGDQAAGVEHAAQNSDSDDDASQEHDGQDDLHAPVQDLQDVLQLN